MIYNLKNYRYKNFKLYKQIWRFLYKCIDKGPYGYKVGVRKINELCGIDEKVDCSQLTLLSINNKISGKFLTNFRKNSNWFLNDPLPAKIKPYKGRLDIQWENGMSCIIDASHINIYQKEELLINFLVRAKKL